MKTTGIHKSIIYASIVNIIATLYIMVLSWKLNLLILGIITSTAFFLISSKVIIRGIKMGVITSRKSVLFSDTELAMFSMFTGTMILAIGMVIFMMN